MRSVLHVSHSTHSVQGVIVDANLPIWYPRLNRPVEIIRTGPDGVTHRISVVLPVRNEALNVRPVLELAAPFADELLVIDGHSTDGTRDIAAEYGARVILDDGTGKGGAIRTAIREASGDILVFIDGDGSHDPHDIPALVEPIVTGKADHVSGSRMLGGSDELYTTFDQVIRLLGSELITLSINYAQNIRLTDCQNGFRAIRRDVAQTLALREKITTIEQEMVIKTVRSGYRLAEVPTHEYARSNGKSRFQVKDVWFHYIRSWLYYLIFWRPPKREPLR
jgi:glycosyltransferase involved in cell wall biosynthesis